MRCRFADIFTFAGEFPKELGDLVNLAHFDASNNKFQGESCAPSYARRIACFADIFTSFAGELPKELGNLVKLKVFNVQNNSIGGKLYAPA